MQCPKCGYEPTMSEIAESPEQCPSCDVYYAKARASQPNPSAKPVLSAQRSDRISERRSTVPASPVVVVDLQMPFMSMVTFMVKWALAAIPAMFILIGFFAGISSLVGVWLTTLFK